jgi:PTS system fructose-specific IIC component
MFSAEQHGRRATISLHLHAEREAGKAAGVLGLSSVTEGAIAFAAKDPLWVIPAAILGSATPGALFMHFSVGLRAPHGGVFVLAIPDAVSHRARYALAIVVGTAITAEALLILKPSFEESRPAPSVRLAPK